VHKDHNRWLEIELYCLTTPFSHSTKIGTILRVVIDKTRQTKISKLERGGGSREGGWEKIFLFLAFFWLLALNSQRNAEIALE